MNYHVDALVDSLRFKYTSETFNDIFLRSFGRGLEDVVSEGEFADLLIKCVPSVTDEEIGALFYLLREVSFENDQKKSS